jgi:hypothetical protein
MAFRIRFSLWLALAVGLFAIPILAEQRDRSREGTPPGWEQPPARDRDVGRQRPRPVPDFDQEEPRAGAEEAPGDATEEGMPAPRGGSAPDRMRDFAASRWRLGVYAYNTSTGVVISRVVPNSPAWNAGLERGDRIVTVSGYQVGYVNRVLHPLGEELQLRAGRNGHVRLLLQNSRNRQLVNRDVSLERRGPWNP